MVHSSRNVLPAKEKKNDSKGYISPIWPLFKKEKRTKKKILLRPSKQNKQEAYLRSIELSVGKKLFFLRPHLPKFFMQLLVYPVTVFCLGMPKLQVSHMCIQKAEDSICYVVWTPFSGVGWGEVVPFIIGYYFYTYYYKQTLFSFFSMSFDLTKFCFAG